MRLVALYLQQWFCMLKEPRDYRMPALMEGNGAALLLVDHLVLLLKASDYSI